mgnify:FL=1
MLGSEKRWSNFFFLKMAQKSFVRKKTEHVLTETLTNILIYFVEQEIKSNRKVSKIELWDEAHKQKKDGEYKNANTKIVMVYFYL